jgi:hypothetical protein
MVGNTEKAKQEIEAWSRFERAVDVVAKSPPQHRTKPKATKRPKVRSLRRRVSSAKPKSA